MTVTHQTTLITHSLQLSGTPLPELIHTDDAGIVIHHPSDTAVILGFTDTPDPEGKLALTWDQFSRNPRAALGKHMITVNTRGEFAIWNRTLLTGVFPKAH